MQSVPLQQSENPVYTVLLTGRYRAGRGYRARRDRGTDDWLMILTLAGSGRFGHGDGHGETAAYPGGIVLVQPHTLHDYGTAAGAEQWDLLWTHFHPRPHWHPWLRWPETAKGVMRVQLGDGEPRGRITERFHEMHAIATRESPYRDEFAMNALEEILLVCATQLRPEPTPAIDPRVLSVQNYIAGHLSEPITLDILAEHVQLSPSRLAQLYRRYLGQTPTQYLESQRLDQARQLLARTTQPVSAVSQAVGYENPFYFTLRFKRETGLAPTEYRKRIDAGRKVGSRE